MSAEQFQIALIRLVRYPDQNRGTAIEAFLNEFELSENEKWQLRSLAVSYPLIQFGKEHRHKRFQSYVFYSFPLTVKVIGPKKAEKIFSQYFEPAHWTLGTAQIAERFYDYFLENEDWLRSKMSFPVFAKDLLRYEFAELSLNHDLEDPFWKISERSLIRPGVQFRILEFNFDATILAKKAEKMKRSSLLQWIPKKKETSVLFVKVPSVLSRVKVEDVEEFVLSTFIIDSDLRNFLRRQVESDINVGFDLPPFYSELVSLGICKNIEKMSVRSKA